MPGIIRQLLNLEEAVGPLKDFQTKVGKVPEQDELDWSIDGFVPHAQGYEYTLSDGVITNLRLNGRQTGWHLERQLTNRDIEIPEEFDIAVAQDRLFDAFKCHPTLLEFSVSQSEPRASPQNGATCFTRKWSHVFQPPAERRASPPVHPSAHMDSRRFQGVATENLF